LGQVEQDCKLLKPQAKENAAASKGGDVGWFGAVLITA
jgi:hypothetical protein